jgi:hypothetical protein
MNIVRRGFLLGALLGAAPVWAQSATQIEVFKSPYCGCCEKWIAHLQDNGFQVKAQNVPDVPAVRRAMGMPDRFASCHSARIGNTLVEGHVPAADLRRLLAEKPKALGLAVPAMPPGSPGMDSSRPMPYDTLLVQADGSQRTFARH